MFARSSLKTIFSALLLLALSECLTVPDLKVSPNPVLAKYGSMPKGLTLESTATGFDQVTKIEFDAEHNKFILNGTDGYENPISKADFVELVKYLKEDDRLGCSISNDKPIYYGKIKEGANMAKKILETDKFLGGVAFAKMERLKGFTLPANYVPQAPAQRTISTVCVFNLTGFVFQKGNGVYKCAHSNLEVTLFPISNKKAADGGHLPDIEAMQQDRFEPEDKANRNHLQVHEQEYLKMPILSQSVKFGEAAAFIRMLRDSNVKLDDLIKQMK